MKALITGLLMISTSVMAQTEMERCERKTTQYFNSSEGQEILAEMNESLKDSVLKALSAIGISENQVTIENADDLGFLTNFWTFKNYLKLRGKSDLGHNIRNIRNGGYIFSYDGRIIDSQGSVVAKTCNAQVILDAGVLTNASSGLEVMALPSLRKSMHIYNRKK
jgi:hypothetical protein